MSLLFALNIYAMLTILKTFIEIIMAVNQNAKERMKLKTSEIIQICIGRCTQ